MRRVRRVDKLVQMGIRRIVTDVLVTKDVRLENLLVGVVVWVRNWHLPTDPFKQPVFASQHRPKVVDRTIGGDRLDAPEQRGGVDVGWSDGGLELGGDVVHGVAEAGGCEGRPKGGVMWLTGFVADEEESHGLVG